MKKKTRVIMIKEAKHMETLEKIKPINPTTIISEEKFVNEIKSSITKQPSLKAIENNRSCVELLRRARRG